MRQKHIMRSAMGKTLFFYLLFSFGLILSVCGQDRVSFAYDAAGNRVKREMVLSRSMPSDARDEAENNTFYDSLGQRTVKLAGTSAGILKIEIIGYEPSDNAFAEVYSLSGIMLLSQAVKDATAELDISGKPSGTYILNVTVNGQQTSWKIAKQ